MADEKNQVNDDMAEDSDLDKIMQEIANEEKALTAAPAATETETETVEATVHPIPSAKAGKMKEAISTNTEEKQSLTLELTGSINLKLRFASGERSIEIECLDDMMVCRMADGTEFRVPVGQSSSKKTAA